MPAVTQQIPNFLGGVSRQTSLPSRLVRLYPSQLWGSKVQSNSVLVSINQFRRSSEALLPGTLAPKFTCLVTLWLAFWPSNSRCSTFEQISADVVHGTAMVETRRVVKTSEIFNPGPSIVMMLKTRGIKYLISTHTIVIQHHIFQRISYV